MRANDYITFATRYLRGVALLFMALSWCAIYAQQRPDAPANLKAKANYSLVTLNWQRSTTVADTLLKEGFEGETFPPEGWQVKTTNENDASFTWFHFPTNEIMENIDDYTSYVHRGNYSAFINPDMYAPYDDGTPGTQEEWLITPAIKGATYLDFFTKLPAQLAGEWAEDETFTNHYYVKVSHDGGQSWQIIWDGRYDSKATDDWQPVSLYLGDPSKGDPIIAFHASSGSDNPDMSLFATWAIDDVRLTNSPASVVPAESFWVYVDGEVLAEDIKALTFTDDSEKDAGEHLYSVVSYNSDLDEFSDAAEVTVNVNTPTYNAPTNVKLTYTYDESTQKYSVQMTWDAPDGERKPAYYTAYCNNAMFGDWLEECEVEQTGLTKGVYNYSVVAVYTNPDGESEAVGDQVALGTRYPARNLTAIRQTDGSLDVAWEAPKASDYKVQGYKIYRGTTLLAEQEACSFTENDSPNGCYDYAVKAIYADGVEATPVTLTVAYGAKPDYELPFTEDFTGGLKPGNWTVTKNRTGLKDNYLWRFDNWYELPVTGGGFDSDFASASSSNAGFTQINTTIYTPQLVRTSIAEGEKTYLEFDMDYMMGGSSFSYIAYSIDGGLNWYDLVSELTGYTEDDLAEGEKCKPQHLMYDVTDLFANGQKVMFAWTYNGKRAHHLAIDNVHVFNASVEGIESIKHADNLTLSTEHGEIHLHATGLSRVTVYSTDGRLVAEKVSNGSDSLTLPMGGKGVYIVRVFTSQGTSTLKTVVE